MRKTPPLLAAALALGAVATADAAPSASTAASNTISLRHTALGNILVAPNGFTLYEFSRDRTNTDNCQSRKGCMSTWPAQLSSSPKAGHGVNPRLLGTIRLKNGSRQVIYNGHPLYRYSGDSGPGQTEYVGAVSFGGSWDAINAKGALVK